MADTVLSFVTTAGPSGAEVSVLVPIAGIGLAEFFNVRAARSLPGPKGFDVGGRFDQFYAGVLPHLQKGTVSLIYAGYGLLWLNTWPADVDSTWLHLTWQSSAAALLFGLVFASIAFGVMLGRVITGSLFGYLGYVPFNSPRAKG